MRQQAAGDAPPAAGPAPAGDAVWSGRGGLGNWPIQLHLVNPRASDFQGVELLVAADCTAFAAPRQLRPGRVNLISCPKLDDAPAYVAKLAESCGTATSGRSPSP